MTTALVRPRFPIMIFVLFVLVLLVVVLVPTFGIVYGPHAVVRHGSEAEIARQCLRNNGATMTMVNPQTHRTAQICGLLDGTFAVVISEGDYEITSFVKNKMHKLGQVIRYLENGGYIQ